VTQRDIPDAVRKSKVATVAEWREAGITENRLKTLARSGSLVRVRRGVYATRPAIDYAAVNPRRGHALQLAAVGSAVGRDAVASHHSAALIHGVDLLSQPRDTVTLTRPPAKRTSRLRSDGIVFHAAELPADHVTSRYGLLVTTVPRTVIDLARTTPFREAVVAADSALQAELTTKAELMTIVGACHRWPGIQQARRVIGFSDERAESALESCARVALAEAGLEQPELQVTIQGPDWSFRVDLCWPEYRVIAEADGLVKYNSRKDLAKQFERDRLLRDVGYQVIHFTWHELMHTPEVVLRRIRAAIAAPTGF
jgi:very-short-patch-repair endonuclease/predicted transcriptional regulator of viral defense system